MLVLLLSALLVLIIWGMLVTKFDIVNPGILFLFIWSFSCFFGVFLESSWGIDVSLFSVFIQSACIISLAIPAIILGNAKEVKKEVFYTLSISWKNILFLLFYLFISCYFIFTILTNLSYELNYDPEFSNKSLLEFVRFEMTHRDDINVGRALPNLLRVNFVLGCITFFLFSHYHFYRENLQKKKIATLILSLGFLLLSVFSAGRTLLLSMIIAYLIIYLLHFAKVDGWHSKSSMKKALFVLSFFPFLFISLFFIIGYFFLNRFGDGEFESVISNISMYISSPIIIFSEGINSLNLYNGGFGEYTFNSLYGTLKSIGFVKDIVSPFLFGVNLGTWTSNVYTANFRYIIDFGFLGAILINLFIGISLGLIYRYIKKSNLPFLPVIFYSMIMYGVLMSFFDEQLFFNINNFIIRWVYAVILFYILVSKSKEKITVK